MKMESPCFAIVMPVVVETVTPPVHTREATLEPVSVFVSAGAVAVSVGVFCGHLTGDVVKLVATATTVLVMVLFRYAATAVRGKPIWFANLRIHRPFLSQLRCVVFLHVFLARAGHGYVAPIKLVCVLS